MPITLVLADDHPIVLEGLRQLVSLEQDLTVLATCRDGATALASVRRHRPDVLVLDLQMPGTNGLEVLRALQTERLTTRVVVLTASLGVDDALEAIRLGAQGLVLKDMAPHLLMQCIRKVAGGEHWLERGVMTQTLTRVVARETAEEHSLLTPRELEIVRLVAGGLRNKEIARRLNITEGTVKTHLYNIYQSVGVDSRVALTLWSQQKNLT